MSEPKSYGEELEWIVREWLGPARQNYWFHGGSGNLADVTMDGQFDFTGLIAKLVARERERCASIANLAHPPDNLNLACTGAWIDAQMKIAEEIKRES